MIEIVSVIGAVSVTGTEIETGIVIVVREIAKAEEEKMIAVHPDTNQPEGNETFTKFVFFNSGYSCLFVLLTCNRFFMNLYYQQAGY